MSRYTANTARSITVDHVGSARSDRLLLTAEDAARLRAALDRARADARRGEDLEALAAALDTAVLVPARRMPPDVVTMRSRLVLKDLESGARRAIVLVYPEEDRSHHGHVSVFTPIGLALLGLSEGALVGWTLPSGRTAVLRVESVEYQPEAAEEFHL